MKVYFGFAGYPEIKKIKMVMMPSGESIAPCLGAFVQVGSFKGICSFSPDSPDAFDVKAVLDYGKRCVDYHRKKQQDLRDSKL